MTFKVTSVNFMIFFDCDAPPPLSAHLQVTVLLIKEIADFWKACSRETISLLGLNLLHQITQKALQLSGLLQSQEKKRILRNSQEISYKHALSKKFYHH